MTQVIRSVWRYSKSIWDHKNMVVHGLTTTKAEGKEMVELKRQAKHFYNTFKTDKYCVPYTRSYLFDCPLLTVQQLSRDNLASWIRSVEEAIAIRQCREKLHQELGKNALYRFLTITKPAQVANTHQGKEIPLSGATTPKTIRQPPASNTLKTRDGQRAKKLQPRAIPRWWRSQRQHSIGHHIIIPSGKPHNPQGAPISPGRGNTHRAHDQDTARKPTFTISRQKGPNSNTTPRPPPEDGEETMLLLKPIWNAL
jgi:hypothetical protein